MFLMKFNPIFSLIAGCILLAVSLYKLKDTLEFLEKSDRAPGVVTRLEELSGGDTGTSYSPVFKIKTKDNQEFTYFHTSSTNPPSWDIGEQAMFVYDPRDPNSARMLTYFGVFSWTIVFMGFGVFLMTMAIGQYLLENYLQKRPLNS
jgi:hypothetical protein